MVMRAPTLDVAKRMLGGKPRKGGKGGTWNQRSREMSSELKAIYHQVSGAGKSRVIRRFFELSDADVAAIVQRVDQGLTDALTKSG